MVFMKLIALGPFPAPRTGPWLLNTFSRTCFFSSSGFSGRMAPDMYKNLSFSAGLSFPEVCCSNLSIGEMPCTPTSNHQFQQRAQIITTAPPRRGIHAASNGPQKPSKYSISSLHKWGLLPFYGRKCKSSRPKCSFFPGLQRFLRPPALRGLNMLPPFLWRNHTSCLFIACASFVLVFAQCRGVRKSTACLNQVPGVVPWPGSCAPRASVANAMSLNDGPEAFHSAARTTPRTWFTTLFDATRPHAPNTSTRIAQGPDSRCFLIRRRGRAVTRRVQGQRGGL